MISETTADATAAEPLSHRSDRAFVWVWLEGAVEPVVAGRLDDRGTTVTFTYARSYLQRTDAVALFLPELPLRSGELQPRSGEIAGCVADSAPDAWGRRVIDRRCGARSELPLLAYLLESGSDRIGALDFQNSAGVYRPREADSATLAELAEAAERVDSGEPLTPALDRALLHGTSVGGARPKALISDDARHVIAKFSSSTDTYAVVKAEFVAMHLARLAGLDVASVEMANVLGKDVLLVERFDRTDVGSRRMMVSALTILERHDAYGIAGRYATYADLAHEIRARFVAADETLRELFARIVFNVLVGNTDDHARNHSAFWDGVHLQLTPAYDVCPQARAGGEAAQAMAFGPDGDRLSQLSRCVAHAGHYHLTTRHAREIVERQIAAIHDHWDEACDLAAAGRAVSQQLWGRQFLNPYALEGYRSVL
ncbi:MAG: type II toxin-antitoxin system HipA family toxin [Acidimicrobiaceae bacterium]|nr:type II toxin-antitoxin system HipA family toxin [Acidimicrobiaceae bacterium]MCY4174779.1 type II toxin-antitoxin system HipA family toxin [Acidimicrobiaceae bacterium]MCY4280033.1 type II toxin-antitoxin system HipA family toxin [Acidimicrobiaceae bacterium]MCY4295031.1 type II toxin-antitoxin system HipA family toxin [Acidimicrobiaceae bacterium]